MATQGRAQKIFGDVSGSWYKGNLHCHSTESDGKKPPADVVAWYKSRGYDFLSLTDHRKVTEVNGDLKFLTIPGVELNTRDVREGRVGLYHVVGIGVSSDCDCRVDDDPQRLIDAIREAGGLPFVAHPKWSGNIVDEEFLQLENYIGIECLNYASAVENNTGQGDIYWDMLSLSGKRVFGIATDDSHSLEGDAGGGWLMVKAESLTSQAILEAIEKGHFYASAGPEIHEVTISDGVISVECSQAAAIHFMTGGPRGKSVWADGVLEHGAATGDLLEQASYTLRGTEKFVRIEVVDSRNRVAWTNPLYFE